MRKYRPFDIINPSAFYILFFVIFLLFMPVFDFFASILIGVNFIFFEFKIETFFVALFYIIIFFSVSYIALPALLGYKPMVTFSGPRLNISLARTKLYLALLSIFSASIFLTYFYQIGIPPALHENVSIFRIEAKKGFGGFILLANASALVYALIFAWVFKYLKNYKVLGVFTLILLAVLSGLTGFRGPAAYILLTFVLCTIFSGNEYVEKKALSFKIFIFAVAVIVVLSILDFVRHGGEVSFNAIFQVFWTLSVNFYNLNLIIENFGEIHNFLLGSSFLTDLMVAFPFVDSEFFGVKLVSILNLSFKGEGMTVTSPGEGYANFGWFGVFLHALILGSVSELVYKYNHIKNRITNHIFLSFFSLSFPKMVASGIMPTLIFSVIPGVIFLIPFFYFCTLRRGE